MIPGLYIKFARGNGKSLRALTHLIELLYLYGAYAEIERRAIMLSGKKVIVIGFNDLSLGRIYISGIRKKFEDTSSIPVVAVHANGFETPNCNICVIGQEYCDNVNSIPADFAYGPEWLRAKVRAFEGCTCEYSTGIPDLAKFIEERETEIAKIGLNSLYGSGIYNDGTGGIHMTSGTIHLACPVNPQIKKVHFSGPVTCVIWTDGTKTTVRCQDGETLDPEKGLAMAVAKKFLGTNESGSNYYGEFQKWLPKKEEKIDVNDWADALADALKCLRTGSLTAGKALHGAVYRFMNGQCVSPSKVHAKEMAAVGEAIAEGLKQGAHTETCRERLKREHPNMVNPNELGGCAGCPHMFGYATKPGLCLSTRYAPREEHNALCAKCWDRPVEEKKEPEHKDEPADIPQKPKRMTFREKLAKEHPWRVHDSYGYGGCLGCPLQYGYEDSVPSNCRIDRKSCRACWDREIPE